MNKFKTGDKVYCPTLSLNVLTIKDNTTPNDFPLRVTDGVWRETFSTQGLQDEHSPTPIVFHATDENCQKLCDLYGVEFEAPPKECL